MWAHAGACHTHSATLTLARGFLGARRSEIVMSAARRFLIALTALLALGVPAGSAVAGTGSAQSSATATAPAPAPTANIWDWDRLTR